MNAPSQKDALLKKLAERTATVGVVGLGYVGLPLALELVQAGHAVDGFDVSASKAERIGRGDSYIRHISDERLHEANAKGLSCTTDFARLAECDALLMCVPTPLTDHRDPDLSYVESTTASIAEHLRAGQLVVLESTTYPGTTRDIVVPLLCAGGMKADGTTAGGMKVGEDFFVAYSPEREDPANPKFSASNTPKVVGGFTPACLEVAVGLYSTIVEQVVEVSSCEAAEASKILENTFRAVNIALINELKMVMHRMDIDVWEVIDAAATKPFGFMRFTPGPGLGGHCIPIDPFYLTWKAREYDMPTRFIEMAGEVNSSMPYYVCQRLLEALSARGRGAKGARILIVGLAYKKNVDDVRESPSYKLWSQLEAWGAEVEFHDPHVAEVPKTRRHPHLAGKRSTPIEEAGEFDVVLIATDHDAVDWAALHERAQLIVDTRGVYREQSDKVVQA